MRRLQRNEPYFFIGNRSYDFKVCHTTDCYFPTDNERWEAHNYFISPSAAKSCADDIAEQYFDQIRDLEKEREENKRKLISAVSTLAAKAKKPALKEKDMVNILSELAKAHEAYATKNRDTNKALTDIDAAVMELISNAPKN